MCVKKRPSTYANILKTVKTDQNEVLENIFKTNLQYLEQLTKLEKSKIWKSQFIWNTI